MIILNRPVAVTEQVKSINPSTLNTDSFILHFLEGMALDVFRRSISPLNNKYRYR